MARTLTDRFGVTVVCRGELAYTDRRRIVLPTLPGSMDEPLERMVIGYLDHELALIAFTEQLQITPHGKLRVLRLTE